MVNLILRPSQYILSGCFPTWPRFWSAPTSSRGKPLRIYQHFINERLTAWSQTVWPSITSGCPAPQCGQDRRKRVRQILGNQARALQGCSFAVQPRGTASRPEWSHTLRHQPDNDAGKHVARPCRGEVRGRIAVDDRPAIRRGDHGIRPLEQDDGAGASRRIPCAR